MTITFTYQVIPQMIHGFLSINWPVIGVNEVTILIKQCGLYLKALIDGTEVIHVPGATNAGILES